MRRLRDPHGQFNEPETAADIARETVIPIPDPIDGTTRFVDEYSPNETIDSDEVLYLEDWR